MILNQKNQTNELCFSNIKHQQNQTIPCCQSALMEKRVSYIQKDSHVYNHNYFMPTNETHQQHITHNLTHPVVTQFMTHLTDTGTTASMLHPLHVVFR